MCTYCKRSHMFGMLTHPPDACDTAVRDALADMLSFVQDVFVGADRQRCGDSFELSPAGCDGLGYILGMIEQSLRFDVERVTPETPGETED